MEVKFVKIFYGLIAFAVAFFAVSLFYYFSSQTEKSASNEPAQTETEKADTTKEDDATKEETESANTSDVNIDSIQNNNCLSCHSISSLGAEGGNTGPDLSNAFSTVEGKHGKSLDEFLKEPTSAVMSTVIGDNPLSDEDRENIVNALKAADEK